MNRSLIIAAVAMSLSLAIEVRAAAAHELPLVEVPVKGSAPTPRFAVMISGDGGWAKIDKAIAEQLSLGGIPVIGVNALQYFWTKKAPETLAADLTSIINSYSSKWKAPEVLLIGYSRGADVLPFAVNRMSESLRGRVTLVALLSPSKTATFEFKMADWFTERAGIATKPEIDRMRGTRTICVYGTDDPDTVCKDVDARVAQPVPLTGAHHFDGDYPALAKIITSRLAQ